ncbi:MAG TPA: mechanosensitive ion channel family protein [Xanthobacteraceae bacterium]|nr:mechanosensitive ion channel family protein [Xanthobacteraceae bacterium]
MWRDVAQTLQAKLAVLNGLRSYAPGWAVSLVIVIVALAIALVLHAAILAAMRRALRDRQTYLRTVLDATKEPTRLAFVLAALAIALPTAPVDSDTRIVLGRILALATIGLIGWIALTVLQISANLYLLRFRTDVADNLMARKHLTQVRVMVRVLDTVIVLLTLGFALMTFDSVRQYGISLFASAGVAGIVFGLAAQPVLSNLIAGVQLALTQPIRLEDAVTVQNEYGWIEEINATYVVIRLWDLRRLIVPLNFFIQQPFYNWTRQAAANIGSVVLYLDYGAPIDRIRDAAAEIVAQSKVDDARVVNVQVTNASAQAIEVRALLTARTIGATSDLCAEVREKLIGFLQHEYPQALPRQRNEIAEAPSRKAAQPPHAPS